MDGGKNKPLLVWTRTLFAVWITMMILALVPERIGSGLSSLAGIASAVLHIIAAGCLVCLMLRALQVQASGTVMFILCLSVLAAWSINIFWLLVPKCIEWGLTSKSCYIGAAVMVVAFWLYFLWDVCLRTAKDAGPGN